ncbi:MAG TPA: SCO family protein [Thermoanaerobaculia bacterium]|nr:SCO family protein [Thermoanaerobaculia bacterium]
MIQTTPPAVRAALLALSLTTVPVFGHEHGAHQHHAAPETAKPAPALPAPERIEGLEIPDVTLLDQEGRPVRFYSDLIKGRVVAVNFVFTSCTAICPPMGGIFGQVRQQLGSRAGQDVHLISVSVDPGTDTPARMKEWGARFGAGPGWTLVTGPRAEIVQVLKAFGAYTADINAHTPQLVLGDDSRGEWTRAYGLAPPAKVMELIDKVAPRPEARAEAPAEPAAERPAAHHYFGDIKLVDQDGRERRLYSDLMAGKTVVIDVMFTTCNGVCPVLSRNLQRVQEALGDRVGKDVHLISISVDPETDTPARLKEYAARYKAGPGWYFLTGPKPDVDAALRKLGQWVPNPEAHQNLILIGNDRTGLWKKALGVAEATEIITVVESVVNDRG